MKTKWIRIVILLGAVAAAIGGGYWLVKKFNRDRENLANFDTLAAQRAQLKRRRPETKTTRVYTEKDIEEARRKGRPLPGTNVPYQPPSNAAADAAVQRSLKTLDDINRINEMNRRLMEQQQRQNTH